VAPKTILRVDKASVNITTVASESALCARNRDESTLNLAVESTLPPGTAIACHKTRGSG
jgi:hypothetical protein